MVLGVLQGTLVLLHGAWGPFGGCPVAPRGSPVVIGVPLGDALGSPGSVQCSASPKGSPVAFRVPLGLGEPPQKRVWGLTLPAVLELMSTQVSAALSQKRPRVLRALWASSRGTEP